MRATAAVSSIAIAGLVIGIVLTAEPSAATQSASAAQSVGATTTVQRRDLILTDTESGTLSYAKPQTVFNRLSGTITSLASIGQVVERGQTLYRVDQAPVVLFNGTVPAYRDLTPDDGAGADILELNRDLRSMGFDPRHQIALDGTWQPATSTGVKAWQASLAETETGTITLGQIVFLPGARRVSALDAALGASSALGAVLQTTSNRLVVLVNLAATKQGEAVRGRPVTVDLPNGHAVTATITEVSAVAQSSGAGGSSSSSAAGSSSAPSATTSVTIRLSGRHRLAGLDQAVVSVGFRQQEEKHVLSVPVTALLATAGGGYALQQASAPHRLIPVTPGLFAAGYVQLAGARIYSGLQVTDSQG